LSGTEVPELTNHEKAYEQIRPWLQNIKKPAEVTFLGRAFSVTKDDVVQLSGDPIHVNAKGVLVWYYTYGGADNPELYPSYDFVLLYTFSHGIFSDQSAWRQNAVKAQSDLTIETVRSAAKRIGADFYRKEKYGESYLLLALPKVPVLITFTEGDDEFEPQLTVKFSSNATEILPFETLAILMGLIEREFIRGQ